LVIGLGIIGASQKEKIVPHLLTAAISFRRRKQIPFAPFVAGFHGEARSKV
jgi:hypothetical protein